MGSGIRPFGDMIDVEFPKIAEEDVLGDKGMITVDSLSDVGSAKFPPLIDTTDMDDRRLINKFFGFKSGLDEYWEKAATKGYPEMWWDASDVEPRVVLPRTWEIETHITGKDCALVDKFCEVTDE